jgi:hypothetical protein
MLMIMTPSQPLQPRKNTPNINNPEHAIYYLFLIDKNQNCIGLKVIAVLALAIIIVF